MSLPVDPHNRVKRSKQDVEEEEDSPAERALRKVGCLELHYRVCLYLLAFLTTSDPHVENRLSDFRAFF